MKLYKSSLEKDMAQEYREKIYSKDERKKIEPIGSNKQDPLQDLIRAISSRQIFINGILFSPTKSGENYSEKEIKDALKKQTGIDNEKLIDSLFYELSLNGFIVSGAFNGVKEELLSNFEHHREIEPRINVVIAQDEHQNPKFLIDYSQISFVQSLDPDNISYIQTLENIKLELLLGRNPTVMLFHSSFVDPQRTEKLQEISRLFAAEKKEELLSFIDRELFNRPILIIKERCSFSLGKNKEVKKEIEEYKYIISKRSQELNEAKLATYRQAVLEEMGRDEMDFKKCKKLIQNILDLHAVANFSIDLDLHNLLIKFADVIELKEKDSETFNRLQALLKKYRPFDITVINKSAKHEIVDPKDWVFNDNEKTITQQIPYLLRAHKSGKDNTHEKDDGRAKLELPNLKVIDIGGDVQAKLEKNNVRLTPAMNTYLRQNINQTSLKAFVLFFEYSVFNSEYNIDLQQLFTSEEGDLSSVKLVYITHNHIRLEMTQARQSENGLLYQGKATLDIKDNNLEDQSEVKNIDVQLIDFSYTRNNLEIAELVYKQKANQLTEQDISRVNEILRAYTTIESVRQNSIVAPLVLEFSLNAELKFFVAQKLCQTNEGRDDLKKLLNTEDNSPRSTKHLPKYLLTHQVLSLKECAEVVGKMAKANHDTYKKRMQSLVRYAVVHKPEGYEAFLSGTAKSILEEMAKKGPLLSFGKKRKENKKVKAYYEQQQSRENPEKESVRIQVSPQQKGGSSKSMIAQLGRKKMEEKTSSLIDEMDAAWSDKNLFDVSENIAPEVKEALGKHGKATQDLVAENKNAELLIVRVFKWLKGLASEFIDTLKSVFISGPSVTA
jgi:hypothetical protein